MFVPQPAAAFVATSLQPQPLMQNDEKFPWFKRFRAQVVRMLLWLLLLCWRA